MFKNAALSLAVLLLIGDVEARHHHHHNRFPGVNNIHNSIVQVRSDPIHGSLGPLKKAKHTDLTPEQQFEQDQRNTPAKEYKDEDETVNVTKNSIAKSEAITGKVMDEPVEKKDIKETPEYHLADSDDEDPETVETRRSVKQIEKRDQHRFFINDKERRVYDQKIKDGLVPEAELNWNEDEDAETGADPNVIAEKEGKKKAALLEKKMAKENEVDEDAGLSGKERRKNEKERKRIAAIEDSKLDTPPNAPGKDVPVQARELIPEYKKPIVHDDDIIPDLNNVDPDLVKKVNKGDGAPLEDLEAIAIVMKRNGMKYRY